MNTAPVVCFLSTPPQPNKLTPSNVKIIVNHEYEWSDNELLKVQYQHSCAVTEENYDKRHSGYPADSPENWTPWLLKMA
jgi:hypothetical protein